MFEMKPCKDEPGFENSENFQHYFQYAESGVDLMLVQCGYEHCEANHYWAGSAEFHRFHVVISGCGTLEIGDKVHHIRAGDAFFIPMDMEVRYRADGVNPWEYRWVSVVGTKMSCILTKMEISRRFCVTLKQADILIDRAKKIYDCACEGSAQGDLMALGHVYFFLAELMEQYGSQVSVEDTSVNYVHRATDYIREHYAGDTSVDSICQWLNISRSYRTSCSGVTTACRPPATSSTTGWRRRASCSMPSNMRSMRWPKWSGSPIILTLPSASAWRMACPRGSTPDDCIRRKRKNEPHPDSCDDAAACVSVV